MSDTPETNAFFFRTDIEWDDEVDFARKLEHERDNIADQRDMAISEMDRLEEERDQARNLAESAMLEADRLRGQLWRARDRAWKLARERSRLKSEISNFKSP